MARRSVVIAILVVFLSTVYDLTALYTWTAKTREKAGNTSARLTGQNSNDSSQLRNKSESNILPSANSSERCNISIQNMAQKSLEFAKLLSEKTTQYVRINVCCISRKPLPRVQQQASFIDLASNIFSSGTLYSWTVDSHDFNGGISLVWVKSGIGRATYSSSLNSQYIQVVSFGTLTTGRKDFEVNINQEPTDCLGGVRKNHGQQLLEHMLNTELRPMTESQDQVKCYKEKSYFFCCKQHQVPCTGFKAVGFPSGSSYLDIIIVAFCMILSPLLLVKISAFFENQTERRLNVPHNFILCKILRILCYKSILPKLLLVAAFVYWALLEWWETGGSDLFFVFSFSFLATVFCSWCLGNDLESTAREKSYAFEEKFFERLIPSFDCTSFCSFVESFLIWLLGLFFLTRDIVVKLHNAVFKPSATFYYSDERVDLSKKNLCTGFFCRLVGTSILIVGVALSFLSLIMTLKYTLFGLLLNHNLYLPTVSLYIIIVFYVFKSCQSFCTEYVSLMINVFNVCEENITANDIWDYKDGIPRLSTKIYEKVRAKLLPYKKNIFKLLIQITFLFLFANMVLNACKILEENSDFPFDVKVVALFGFSTLPYILKVFFWEQSEAEKKILDKAQCKKIQDILLEEMEQHDENFNQTNN